MTKLICDVCGKETERFERANQNAKVRGLFIRDGKPVDDICPECVKQGTIIMREEVHAALDATRARLAKLFHDAPKTEMPSIDKPLRRQYVR